MKNIKSVYNAIAVSCCIILLAAAFSGYTWYVSVSPFRPYGQSGVVFRRPMPEPLSSDLASGSQPRRKMSLFLQALAFQKSGRFHEAKQFYFAALEHSPNLVSAWNNLGVIYIGEKDYDNARQVLEKATSENPAYVDPFYNFACLYALQGDLDRSLGYLEKAILVDNTVRIRAKQDRDLDGLRDHEQYEKLMTSMDMS